MIWYYVVAGSVLVIVTAVLNWKMSFERAKKWTNRVVRAWIIFFMIGSFFYLPYTVPRQNELALLKMIAFILIPLLFFTTTYIPYMKNKADPEMMRFVIKEAITINISVVLLAIVFIIAELYRVGIFDVMLSSSSIRPDIVGQ